MLNGSCVKANAKPNKKNPKKEDFESVIILDITNQLLKFSLNLFMLRGSASNTENSFPEESATTSPRDGIRLVILNTKPPIVSYSSPFLFFVKSTPVCNLKSSKLSLAFTMKTFSFSLLHNRSSLSSCSSLISPTICSKRS